MRVPVTFDPTGAVAWIDSGSTVLQAARAAGVSIEAPCAGRGVCGGCAVRIIEGSAGPCDDVEVALLRHAPSDLRLACRAVVHTPLRVRPVVAGASSSSESQARCAATVVVGVDLGTTNVTAVAVDASTGREVGRGTAPNSQRTWGADVLSRLAFAMSGDADALRMAAWDSVTASLDLALRDCTPRPAIGRIVIAANTAMATLLCGADPASLAHAPFEAPAIPTAVTVPDGLPKGFAGSEVLLIPPLSSFVGGDILSGLQPVLRDPEADSVLLVDIGTNAEVALWHGGRLTVTSAPAGPAFEGEGLSSGGPAMDGAVTRVSLDQDGRVDRLETIGDAAPRWLSGAGLVSAVAAHRATGDITEEGEIVMSASTDGRILLGDDGVRGIRLSPGIVLTQLDVRTFQLAKAAVAVAVSAVLRHAGVRASDLRSCLVAGAFGMALRSDDLVDVGVVPVSVRDIVCAVGNASVAGAVALAFDEHSFASVTEVLADVDHVALAEDPDFMGDLMAATGLRPYDL